MLPSVLLCVRLEAVQNGRRSWNAHDQLSLLQRYGPPPPDEGPCPVRAVLSCTSLRPTPKHVQTLPLRHFALPLAGVDLVVLLQFTPHSSVVDTIQLHSQGTVTEGNMIRITVLPVVTAATMVASLFASIHSNVVSALPLLPVSDHQESAFIGKWRIDFDLEEAETNFDKNAYDKPLRGGDNDRNYHKPHPEKGDMVHNPEHGPDVSDPEILPGVPAPVDGDGDTMRVPEHDTDPNNPEYTPRNLSNVSMSTHLISRPFQKSSTIARKLGGTTSVAAQSFSNHSTHGTQKMQSTKGTGDSGNHLSTPVSPRNIIMNMVSAQSSVRHILAHCNAFDLCSGLQQKNDTSYSSSHNSMVRTLSHSSYIVISY